MLYAGPLPASQVVLPVGQFVLTAEVYDEADAFGTYQVKNQHYKVGQILFARVSIYYCTLL